MNYLTPVKEMAAAIYSAAKSKCKKREIKNKTVITFHGYIITRCKPSGMYIVFHEIVGKEVIVDSLGHAKRIVLVNCTSE